MVAVRLVRQNVRRSRFALEPDERQREKFPLLQITLECVCVWRDRVNAYIPSHTCEVVGFNRDDEQLSS